MARKLTALAAIVMLLWIGGAIALALALPATLAASARRRRNLWVAIDQLGNAFWFGGDPDETISSYAGRLCSAGDPPAWARSVAWLTHQVEADHVAKSIEEDEGKDAER